MSRENALCAILCGTVGKGYHLGSAEPFSGGFGNGPKQRFRRISEAHKSLTAAVVALGGVVFRSVTDAVKNGSQIADRFTISWFSGKQKKDSIPVFSHFVKTTKTESLNFII